MPAGNGSCLSRLSADKAEKAFAPSNPGGRLTLAEAAGGRSMSKGPGVGDAEDKALMLRFQEQGELVAFEVLFSRHKVQLLRFLCRLTHSPDLAEEVSQQTWLKLIEAARNQKYNPTLTSTFATWLYTLARNYYVDRYIRAYEVKNRVSESEAGLEEIATPAAVDQGADTDRVGRILQAAIDRLPLEQREVILLWARGHDLTAIAQICGAPWATVVSRKKYALGKLRSELLTLGIEAGDT
jgi:RNA polymerase sigma-70 factor (ECF subfamily)